MGPMFPRLHVNDTVKGGPKAPPRNKMALYEQLSIPSQRFKPGGNGHERALPFPIQLQSPRNSAEKFHAGCSDSNTALTKFESRRKAIGDDSGVCVFVNSNAAQGLGKFCSNSDREKVATYSVCPNKGSKLSTGRNTRPQKSPKQLAAIRERSTKADVHLQHKLREDCINNVDRLDKNGINLQPEDMDDSQVGSINQDSAVIRGVKDGDSSILVKDFRTGEQMLTINLVSDAESQENREYTSLQTGNVGLGEDSSEISVVECVSGVDVIHEDIVGLIGKNHFWKARRSILHQQRLFALQVFELHRLIKVQKLIAESPHLLEGSAYIAKSLNGSSAKRLPLEYIVKEPQNVSKRKNGSERPNYRMEFSAENTVGKASFSSVQNGSQPPSCRPSVESIRDDSDVGPWCFHQSSGHQWLVPVMSPSEGLVYKPYPGPGFTNPVCGGCGPPGSTPVNGQFSVPEYHVPASRHHYQGIGAPFAPPSFNGYFPPYGMPPVDEITQLVGMGSQGQKAQHQNSRKMPSQQKNSVVVSNVSTASSPSIAAWGFMPTISSEMEGTSVLRLPPAPSAAQAHYTANPARVIRAVPHNASSATEYVARIFQSIQEERKQKG